MNERDCDNCIHKKQKLSIHGSIYSCELWDCEPEYIEKDDSDKRNDNA